MTHHRSPCRLVLTLVSSVFVVACGQAARAGQQPAQGTAAQPTAKGSVLTLNLADCIHAALDHQPRIAAARASLASAEESSRALEAMSLAALVDKEISIRRRQACLGVTAASAGVDQAEREAVWAVTRTYCAVLFAREQESVAESVVERLSATRDAAKKQLDAGVRTITSGDVQRATVYTRLAQAKRVQASQGVKRALAALREAVGLEPDVNLDIPPGRLPEMMAQLSRDEIVAAALARRGEMIRAGIFVEVTCLEVEAQGSCALKKKETVPVAGTDIHAIVVPQEVRDPQYRPGAIPPEMPILLIGSRSERMKHAQDLHCRARAVADVTRNLIVLEAEDALLRWQEASSQIPDSRDAADQGDKLATDLRRR